MKFSETFAFDTSYFYRGGRSSFMKQAAGVLVLTSNFLFFLQHILSGLQVKIAGLFM
jgi:hypothetical protein